MTKTIIILTIVIGVIIALIFAGNNVLNLFRAFLMGEPDIIQVVVSPDGKYVAYVFEGNTGATTQFTYRLSVLKNGKKLNAGDIGNTYISYYIFDVEWIDNNTLKVNNTSSVDIFEQKTSVLDIHINYNYNKD